MKKKGIIDVFTVVVILLSSEGRVRCGDIDRRMPHLFELLISYIANENKNWPIFRSCSAYFIGQLEKNVRSLAQTRVTKETKMNDIIFEWLAADRICKDIRMVYRRNRVAQTWQILLKPLFHKGWRSWN